MTDESMPPQGNNGAANAPPISAAPSAPEAQPAGDVQQIPPSAEASLRDAPPPQVPGLPSELSPGGNSEGEAAASVTPVPPARPKPGEGGDTSAQAVPPETSVPPPAVSPLTTEPPPESYSAPPSPPFASEHSDIPRNVGITQTSPPAATAPAPEPVPTASGALAALLTKARAALQARKRKKLERIVEFAKERGKITNDDVEKLLRVSDATATNYLAQLVREGKLTKTGVRGGAFYELP